ncbi:VWA domain-containing protein [Mycobacterium sp. SM1]|uniref:VWA domain-containing protein n=1 Tax=Mycobacterium sp. SM1 TaxID=2816243 RepID=UPI001BCC984A|nr:VWA domain-containing protein [Mycobacterium sp. SM1]MBS4728969.1 VWA domain-containing protein [Mycobacterium sp. SM1]
MTLPGIGPLPLSGFQRPGMLLFGLVPLALLAVYLATQARRRQRLRRFTEESVPQPAWRHVPLVVALVGLALLTVALATPSHSIRIPRSRAIIMLVIDVSQSMRATDVPPDRLQAAEQAAARFAGQLTPGIDLGLVAFAGTPYLLVPPTVRHQETLAALKNLQFANSTATGDAIFTALQAIATTATVTGGGPLPARVVLLSDGAENVPEDPNNPHGAYTAARLAKNQGVPISTITFGTHAGSVDLDGQLIPVPADPEQMKTIARLSGGQAYAAGNIGELNQSYDAIQQAIGYRTVRGPASAGWLRLGAIAAVLAAVLALVINRRAPT